MPKFEPERIYHIGQLTTTSQRNPSAPPTWYNPASKVTLHGHVLIDKYKTPDTETFYDTNPLKLPSTRTFYIYEAEPDTGLLKYVAGANFTARAERSKPKPRQSAAQPQMDAIAALGDQMMTLRDDLVSQGSTIEQLRNDLYDTRTQLLEKDRIILELQKEIEVRDAKHSSQIDLIRQTHESQLQALEKTHQAEIEAISAEAAKQARTLADKEKSATLEGFIDRYEPKVRPLIEAAIDRVMARISPTTQDQNTQQQQPALPPPPDPADPYGVRRQLPQQQPQYADVRS